MDDFGLEFVAYKAAVHFNVFRPFMKYRIVGYVDSALVVAIDINWCIVADVEVVQNEEKSLSFAGCVCQCTIFCFRR